MWQPGRMGRSVGLASLVASLTLLIATNANPITPQLERRRPTLKDSETITIDGTAPLDAILLVGVALGSAVCCICLALWNIYMPSMSGSSKAIRDERARAKTELRLKGAGSGGSGGSSPSRMMGEKKRTQSVGMETLSTTADSHTRILPSSPFKSNPRIAPSNGGRLTRAARGYSSYSKYDVAPLQSRPSFGMEPTLSMLNVPTLPAAFSDTVSSPSVSSGSITPSLPNAPWHARPAAKRTSHSFSGRVRRISTSVGRGTDLNRNRSGKRALSRNIHVNPQAVDPTYVTDRRLSPRTSASELNDPLSGHELKRYTTDPTDSRDSSRRNSAMNALDFFNNPSSRSPLTDSGSEEAHNRSALSSPASGVGAAYRSRPMAFYEADTDVGGGSSSSGHQHYQDAALLESGGNPELQQGGGGWRMWGKF